MADGVCAEGTTDGVKDSGVVKQSVDLLSISHKECLSSNTLNKIKSAFYIDEELCGIDGVVGLGVRATAMLCGSGSSEFCPNNGDNCRKKRCADRYDSSESSDSGVATLSCSSSGTSDITDPGSPYSTASTHSSASEGSDDCTPRKNVAPTTLALAAPPYCGIVTPPVQSRHWTTSATSCKTVTATTTVPTPGDEEYMAPQEPCWPWGGKERDKGPPPPPPPLVVNATPLTPVTANVIANLPLKSLKRQTAITSHKTATGSTKRLKVDHCVRVTSPQQGKITEYFKPGLKYFLSGTKLAAAKASSRNADVKKESVNCSSTWKKSPGIEGKTSKTSQKLITDKKTGTTTTIVTARKASSSISSKFLESKRIGSNVTSSQKLSALLSSSSSTLKQSNHNLTEISSNSGTLHAGSDPEKISKSEPILSVPTTIRFPAAVSDSSCSSSGLIHPKPSSSQSESPDTIICRWFECSTHFDTSTVLLEHLQVKHVNPQVTCENYVCLWVGCKVYGRTSCSRSWLERHVLSHGGNKPFRCIVDGCGQRFSSQTTLERHVNSHFNHTEAGNGNAGARRSLESVTSKLFRRNGKKLRYRRQPWSARMFDYFDAGIMEGLQHRLINMTDMRTRGNVATAAGHTVSLHSKVLARRVLPEGKIQVLLRWYPPDILPDEWVTETEIETSRNVPIPSLSPDAMTALQTTLFMRGNNKQRRKPVKCT